MKHCLERIARVQNITSEEVKDIESDGVFISRICQVKSMSKESYLQDETSNENFETNKTDRKVSKFEELTVKKEKVKVDFSCREIMREIKLLTYIIENHNAPENLKKCLTEARDEFAHYGPTNRGLVVQNSKEKVKLDKSLK